jgi:hypothetical protein
VNRDRVGSEKEMSGREKAGWLEEKNRENT